MRLATLPPSDPLHKPLRTSAKRFVKRHRSPLHYLSHIFKLIPDEIETITATRRHPKSTNPFIVQIADTRDESIVTLNDDTADIKIFADGSGLDGKAGAA
jgi:hypothetical protein